VLYTNRSVDELYQRSLAAAQRQLAALPIASGDPPKFSSLSGWVYEQTIRHCLKRELSRRGIRTKVEVQRSLGGRSKADLSIANVCVEVKAGGIYGLPIIRRYQQQVPRVRAAGLEYLYLTAYEGWQPFRTGISRAFGPRNTFFLDTPGHWKRFVRRVVDLAKRNRAASPSAPRSSRGRKRSN
jgi:hypothetical protein